MAPLEPARHLRLVRDAAHPRRSLWHVLVFVLGVIGLAWYIAEWRASTVLQAWESEHASAAPVAGPTVAIECFDWRGAHFGVELTVTLEEAERVARTIERGIAPPYQPTCMTRRLP